MFNLILKTNNLCIYYHLIVSIKKVLKNVKTVPKKLCIMPQFYD